MLTLTLIDWDYGRDPITPSYRLTHQLNRPGQQLDGDLKLKLFAALTFVGCRISKMFGLHVKCSSTSTLRSCH